MDDHSSIWALVILTQQRDRLGHEIEELAEALYPYRDLIDVNMKGRVTRRPSHQLLHGLRAMHRDLEEQVRILQARTVSA